MSTAVKNAEPNPFQARVMARLIALRRDPFEAARHAGFTDRRFIYDITILRKESVRGANLEKLAKGLDWTVPDLLGHGGGQVGLPPDVRLPKPGQEPVKFPQLGNRDVPVLGTGVGGDDADFRLNGQTIDYVARPPAIAHKKGVFALYLQNNSMYPVLKHGDPAYVDPNLQPQPGEDVVVEMNGADGEPGDAFVKRLVRRSASKIVVEQFNPQKQIEFSTKDVRQVLRIIPWSELIAG